MRFRIMLILTSVVFGGYHLRQVLIARIAKVACFVDQFIDRTSLVGLCRR
jgi:hypothetical protein